MLLLILDFYKYLLRVAPVKLKDGKSVSKAFAKIYFNYTFKRPRRLQTYKGKEFYNLSLKGIRILRSTGKLHITCCIICRLVAKIQAVMNCN